MAIISKYQPTQSSPNKRTYNNKNTPTINKNQQIQQESQSEITINVYNYFLDDFPKKYNISLLDTIQSLKQKIVQDTQLRIVDIKNFKDERGNIVQDNVILSQMNKNSNLNMEIFFNENIIIKTNNKNILYFMYYTKNSNTDFTQIYNAIISYKNSEKGGKILVGVESNGTIKGINIPEQDQYKLDFLLKFKQQHQNSKQILQDVDISFFRVKGQNQNTYNYHDHKKIMIIKIKGQNQQSKVNFLQNSEREDDKNLYTYSSLNQLIEHDTKQQLKSQNNVNNQISEDKKKEIQDFVEQVVNLNNKQEQYSEQIEQMMQKMYNSQIQLYNQIYAH